MNRINLFPEKWNPIVGFSDYAVSNQGRIMRLKPGPATYQGKLLKFSHQRQGYLLVDLGHKKYLVHRMVALTFMGQPPKGKEINHIDGKKANNKLSNLEYLTSSENDKHAFDLGLKIPLRGSRNGRSKLTQADVIEIINLRKQNVVRKEIAKTFRVSLSTIKSILRGDNWNWFTKIK